MSNKRIDDAKVIKLLNEGFTPTEIARDKWREVLLDPNDNRPISKMAITNIKNKRRHKLSKGLNKNLTFEQVIETILQAFELSLKVPKLEEENYHLRNQLAATKDALKQLEAELNQTRDQKRRWQLIKQGNLPGIGSQIT